MKKMIAETWVSALRSGRYKQGTHCLREGDEFDVAGVLCDVYVRIRGEAAWVRDSDAAVFKIFSESVVIPDEILGWSGASASSLITLQRMNDEGANFIEIARVIENNWQDL